MDDPLFAPFEYSIKQKIDTAIRDITAQWGRVDGPLFERYCRLRKEIEILKGRKERLESDVATLQGGSKDAKERFDSQMKEIRLGKKAYWLIMLGLAFGEFPLNSQVFAILGERTELTYLFAATLAICLPLAAHLLGMFIRRRPFRPGGSVSERAMLIAMLLVPVAVIGGVAYMREKFLEGSGVTKALGIEMNPTTVTWMFLSFNLMIFLVALAASYFAHDPEFDVAQLDLNTRRKDLGTVAKELSSISRVLDDREKDFAELEAKRQQTFRQFDHSARTVKDSLQIVMEIYRSENLRQRATRGDQPGVRPLSFRDYPPQNTAARMPEELNWTCGGTETGGPRTSPGAGQLVPAGPTTGGNEA